MALIQINEVKRQKPSNIVASDAVKKLEASMPEISKRVLNGERAFTVLNSYPFVEKRLIENVRGVKDQMDALNIIYNYILHAEGDGVLKEYTKRRCPYKGSAIGGMECHSPRL